MESLYQQYGQQVEFLMVYIREAHPTDGWQLPANEREGVLFAQPTSLADRSDVAHKMCSVLKISLPAVVDKLDDQVNHAYSAWPDRLYLVDQDGRVAFKGAPGPGGFKPQLLKAAIDQELAESKIGRQ